MLVQWQTVNTEPENTEFLIKMRFNIMTLLDNTEILITHIKFQSPGTQC